MKDFLDHPLDQHDKALEELTYSVVREQDIRTRADKAERRSSADLPGCRRDFSEGENYG